MKVVGQFHNWEISVKNNKIKTAGRYVKTTATSDG